MSGSLMRYGNLKRTTVAAQRALNASAVEHCGLEIAPAPIAGGEVESIAGEPSSASSGAEALTGGLGSSSPLQTCEAIAETG